MKTLDRDVLLWLGATPYHVEFYSDYEVRFRAGQSAFVGGFISSAYERAHRSDVSSVRLFKAIGRVVVNYLHETKPPYIWFSAGWDATRFTLYRALALRLSKHGYHLAYDADRPNIYYAYRQ